MKKEDLIQAICTMGSKDRNKKCPCGSGKKFKKCCQIGVDATRQTIKAERRIEREQIRENTDER